MENSIVDGLKLKLMQYLAITIALLGSKVAFYCQPASSLFELLQYGWNNDCRCQHCYILPPLRVNIFHDVLKSLTYQYLEYDYKVTHHSQHQKYSYIQLYKQTYISHYYV